MLSAVLLLAIIAVLVTPKQNIDCLEGQEECTSASNYILDGDHILPMTEAEREQFDKYMEQLNESMKQYKKSMKQYNKYVEQFNQQMQSSMHNLRQTLDENLISRKQNLANGFLQGLTVDLNNTDRKRTLLYMMLSAALLLGNIAVLVTSKQNIDCLEGQEECKDASTTYILDGNAIKCCKNGYCMNSISNSFINGVRVEYCKCTLYHSNGGFSRPMTEAEREQFDKSMKQFNQEMQSSMHNLSQALAKNLGSLKQNLANGFLQGLTADLNNIGNQIVASNLPPEE